MKDFVSDFLSTSAHKIHPDVGRLYDKHQKFFNDGLVEIICLLIANFFIAVISYSYIGLVLILVSGIIITPITFFLKYYFHKHWVWK